MKAEDAALYVWITVAFLTGLAIGLNVQLAWC